MKSIQTVYKGYRFRSRLEARWAVFFDALDLPWEYEPEGFELGEGLRYLPDFRVTYPGRGADEVHTRWFEVKADLRDLSHSDWVKLLRFSQEQGLIILDGAPSARMYLKPEGCLQDDGGEMPAAPYKAQPHALEHERCGWALWCAKGRLWWDEHVNFFSPTTYFGHDTSIEDAANKARAARFEFGEVGA